MVYISHAQGYQTMDPDLFITWAEFPEHGIPQYSRRHTNVLVDTGTFPPPVRLTANRLAWRLRDLERWKATRPLRNEPPPVLWPRQTPERGRGRANFAKPGGRPRGSRVVTDADGRRRVVRAEELT
jgi:Prophage CP4-57 regulatory protein (AlpA)